MRIGAALAGLALMAGCGVITPQPLAEAPPPPAATTPKPPPAPPVAEATPKLPAPQAPAAPDVVMVPGPPSVSSQRLAEHYARIQADLLARGHLRRDGGAEIPVGSADLVRDVIAIAFHDEPSSGGVVPAPLRRWSVPVRIGVEFGASVSPAQRVRDRGHIAELAQTLARASGHPVSMTGDRANLTVFVVNEDERRALGERLAAALPDVSATDRAQMLALPSTTYCAAYAFGAPGRSDYAQAVALIRAEHPALLRQSCIHEELAQAMGLAADSPKARPSIFNDDEEFALLTLHDQAMLKILYDPRLTPGMTEDEARPIIETIAAELAAPTS